MVEYSSGPIILSFGPKQRDPRADQARLTAIQQTLRGGDLAAAAAMADTALEDGLEHPMLFNLSAGRLEQEGRFEDALARLQRGCELAPSDVGLRQALGLCLLRLQRSAAALPQFEAVIDAQPGFAAAHAARGAALAATNDPAGAEAAYRRALELQADNLAALAGLASLASGQGRQAEARALAERVVRVEPGYPEAVVVLARSDLADGRTAEAEARLRALIADPRASAEQRVFAHGLLGGLPNAGGRTPDP